MNSNIKLDKSEVVLSLKSLEKCSLWHKNALRKALMMTLYRSPDVCWVSEWLDVTPDN